MNKKNVDSDKIVNHIKYTRHWLDKANTDFLEQRFAEGSVILNIARAELTAAWEEVMHLKTQVTTTIPRKARDNWKPLSSVGLLAAGFMISMFVTKLTTVTVPTMDSALRTMPAQTDVMLVREEEAPTIAEETQYVPTVLETAQSGDSTSPQNTVAESAAQNLKISNETQSPVQAANPAQKTIKKRTVQFTGTKESDSKKSIAAPSQIVAIDSADNKTPSFGNTETQAVGAKKFVSVDKTSESISAVAGEKGVVEKTGLSEENSSAEKTVAEKTIGDKTVAVEKQKSRQLHQNDIIDLFTTARKALHK